MRPRIWDSVKVIYFDSINPVIKVIGKTIRKDAICGLIAINPRLKTCFFKIKL